jgi:group I intron endonuclease
MFVYLVTNIINQKKYVGQHSKDSLEAYWRHCSNHALSGSSDKPCLYNAVRKYGAENFSIEPLIIVGTKWEMDLYEKALIKILNTRRPAGYNLTDGGDGVLGLKQSEESNEKNRQAHLGIKQSDEAKEKKRLAGLGRRHSEETKQKMSQHAKSKEHRQKISIAKMGNKSRTGMKSSKTTRERISSSLLGKPLSESHIQKLKIGGHNRWHVKRNINNPKCKLCQGQ